MNLSDVQVVKRDYITAVISIIDVYKRNGSVKCLFGLLDILLIIVQALNLRISTSKNSSNVLNILFIQIHNIPKYSIILNQD